MKLTIDTANNLKTIVILDDYKLEENYKNPRQQHLLEVIEKALLKKKAKFSDIDSIKVNLGPGSFTGLRVGCSVANTLGFFLRIPINGKKVGQLVEPKYK